MSDPEELNSELTFEAKSTPAATHENWVMRKLHDMEMASEIRIKGETMGLDTRQWLTKTGTDFVQAAIAGQMAANAEHNYDYANMILAAIGIRNAVKAFFKSPSAVMPKNGRGLPASPTRFPKI